MTPRAVRATILLGVGVLLTHGPGLLPWLGYVFLVCFVAFVYRDLDHP
jgi:hypothetical protein